VSLSRLLDNDAGPASGFKSRNLLVVEPSTAAIVYRVLQVPDGNQHRRISVDHGARHQGIEIPALTLGCWLGSGCRRGWA
jgi:hypothetical protein